MTDEQIKHMVDRFLMWRLPENFNPDGGISFKKIYNEKTTYGPQKHEPVGTNLFDSMQAEAMIRHLVEGLPNDSIRNELIAQVAELKKDAERYRWLCVSDRVTKMIASSFLDPANSKADIDGMIDAAKEGK